nr:serine/threonine protein kinase [Deltaproteobacteria bacterium]
MVSDEGGPVPPTGQDPSGSAPGAPARPRTPTSSDEAFAATIAPTAAPTAAPTPAGLPSTPPHAPIGTLTRADSQGPSPSQLESQPTQAAALLGALPPLPLVDAAFYKADREIARGGMGRIVAAEDQRLGRRVALKELLEPAGEQLTRFHREALITARLQHPGIVPVYEAGRWPTGEPFFAMKLVSGRPLDRVIADARTLEERLALLPRIAAAADAIAYAHSQRVVHRDLKPANVLIGEFGETVVIDWGLAKDLRSTEVDSLDPQSPIGGAHDQTVAGAVMGTPAFMPPEQARGEAADERSDIYAIGAILYSVLCGSPPVSGERALEDASAGSITPLREREPAVPPELASITERAMAFSRLDRYG